MVDLEDREGDSICFVVAFGTITANAVTAVKAQHRASSSDSWEDIAGTEVSIADDADNDLAIVDVKHPKRLVRAVVERGTANAVVDGAIAIVYSARTAPVAQPADVAGHAIVNG